jgi:hypothetical protein
METNTEPKTGPLLYLDKALGILKSIGFPVESEANAPALALTAKLESLDQEKAIVIARTLQQASHFNDAVRSQISDVSISQRQEELVKIFDKIRENAKRLVEQSTKGKPGFFDRFQNFTSKMAHGDIPSQYQHAKEIYLAVGKDQQTQITREETILEAYQNFRIALKESQIASEELLQKAEKALNDSKNIFATAQQTVNDASNTDAPTKSRLELERDQKMLVVKATDHQYQIAKDLAENLKISYQTGDTVMARLQQTTEVKQRVYNQAVTFFSTNENVFVALSATATAQAGLAESTKTLNAMKDGINKGLEDLAQVGNTLLEEGVKAGYGPTINAASVKMLVDSIVKFQETSRNLITEARQKSADNANEIAGYVEEGKRRFAKALNPIAEKATE